jgi:hypothetical protein
MASDRVCRWGVMVAIGLALAAFVVAIMGTAKPSRPDLGVIEATRFVVKRPDGSIAVEIGEIATGESGLVIRSSHGKRVAILGYSVDGGTVLSLADLEGRGRINAVVPGADSPPFGLPTIVFNDATKSGVHSICPECSRAK